MGFSTFNGFIRSRLASDCIMQAHDYHEVRGRAQRQHRLPHNSAMTLTFLDRPTRQNDDRDTPSCRGAPRARRPVVSSYRVFIMIVFGCVVLVDEWFDRSLSGSAISDVVGSVSVVIWAMTLLGSFGLGPVAAIWNAMRR